MLHLPEVRLQHFAACRSLPRGRIATVHRNLDFDQHLTVERDSVEACRVLLIDDHERLYDLTCEALVSRSRCGFELGATAHGGIDTGLHAACTLEPKPVRRNPRTHSH